MGAASGWQKSEIPAQALDRQLRICVLSDGLSGALDEGVKKFTSEVAASLAKRYQVVVLSTVGPVLPSIARWVPTSRTFISMRLRAELQQLQPDVLLYATQRSATFFSFVRSRLLRRYCPNATIVLFGLQTRRHPKWQQRVIRHIRPDLICVQSQENGAYLSSLGCAVVQLPCGVDTNVFQPVTAERRQTLRRKYNLDPDKPTVLHVGHLKRARGVQVLAEIAAHPGYQAVLATSSSTAQDVQLRDELRAAGVAVFTDFLPRIAELYQLADCYLFPVTSTDEAIEMPLSVLEALACDLPVVTTRFGGLPAAFANVNGAGLSFVDSPAQLAAEAIRLCTTAPRGTRALVEPFSWDAVAINLIAHALAVQASSASQSRRSASVATTDSDQTEERTPSEAYLSVTHDGRI